MITIVTISPLTILSIKANILIDKNGHALLGDFGLTFDPESLIDEGPPPNAGTTRWMSPELLLPEEFGFSESQPTKQSDCYALGMVVLEVLSGGPPFARVRDFVVMRKVIGGERPERPEGVFFTDRLWRTLQQCWSPRPKSRPTARAILDCLWQVSGGRQPLSSISEDSDGDDLSTISQCMFLYFVPTPYLSPRKTRVRSSR